MGMQQEIMGSLLPTQKEQPPGTCTPSDSAQITDQVPQLIFLNSQKEKKPKQASITTSSLRSGKLRLAECEGFLYNCVLMKW